VSVLIYEGQPQRATGSERLRLRPKSRTQPFLREEEGLAHMPVEHEGNVQASEEQADVVAKVPADLLGRSRNNDHGRVLGKIRATTNSLPARSDNCRRGKIGPNDIPIMAPCNLQERWLRENRPDLRVGSVDKLQRQAAKVVIISLCSSFGNCGSRGLEFILDPNRLNVALTRARTLAVVGAPRIATSPATNAPP
jgi:hypothetical protein